MRVTITIVIHVVYMYHDYICNSSRMCVVYMCAKSKVEILTFCDFWAKVVTF